MTGAEKLYWKMYQSRELLSDGWCKSSCAQLPNGLACGWSHPQAVKFCMLGASAKVTDDVFIGSEMRNRINAELYSFLPSGMSIANFNDHNATTLSDVLSVYDKALAKLKGEFNNNV